MNNILIVTLSERLEDYKKISDDYGVGFEINDFYNPSLLDDECKLEETISRYLACGIPKNSTLHGAFYDIILFSFDAKVRENAQLRMRQSMEIARRLGVKGVVFHTNCMPALSGEAYDKGVILCTSDYLELLLKEYSDIEIYLENMFDDSPDILVAISQRLKKYSNFGVCLDYAHASIYAKDTKGFIEAVIPYVKHLHINDNDLLKDRHWAVGKGSIDWGEFKRYYDEYFCSSTVLVETTSPEAQIESLEYLKSI